MFEKIVYKKKNTKKVKIVLNFLIDLKKKNRFKELTEWLNKL